ncbi:uncharacterized protein LOC130788312 [Actinidia eriantha]|uniref:uncharacterized protein LOC130788312 n=1 Tax=Actinidia eriantha TaxID=165200 RepID=UPI00258CC634|nr:uncharacterized protein LOC130788312 [Actinidia eriantha]
MPLLDIATAQPSFHNHIFTLGAKTLLHNKILFGNDRSLAFGWKSYQVPERGKNYSLGSIGTQRSVLVIRAVATLEPKYSVESNEGHDAHDMLRRGVDSGSTSGIEHQSSREDDSEELDEREKLRRKKISAANKGNMPWNKGRKHSAETLQRIRERTRLAMQNPKVRMKLVKMGHAQSEETRVKIGAGVRMGWERRREKLMLQESCCFDWQNLIAEASRSGFVGEEELQWDSYKILGEQLEQEWLESVEQRKKIPRAKGSKRAPKSLEQRRKISEAISAKWADPVFREKVCSALSRYHGVPVGTERNPRRRPSGERQPRTQSPIKKKVKDTDNSSRIVTQSQKHQIRLTKSKKPLYKDPLASSKLEMIKNIRAQRAATETKKTEAIEQAKLLIAEAEKAANALELAAMTNPLAQASLTETRKLIAEAIQSIQSIEIGQISSHEDDQHPSITPVDLVNHAEKETYPGIHCLDQTDRGKVNGNLAMVSSKSDIKDFGFGEFNFQDLLNGKDEGLPTSSTDYGLLNGKNEVYRTGNGNYGLPPSVKPSSFTERLSQFESNGKISHEKELLLAGDEVQTVKKEIPLNSTPVTKKWVRGRLVEEEEEEEEEE